VKSSNTYLVEKNREKTKPEREEDQRKGILASDNQAG